MASITTQAYLVNRRFQGWRCCLIFASLVFPLLLGCDVPSETVSRQEIREVPNVENLNIPNSPGNGTLVDFNGTTANQVLPVELGKIRQVHRFENLILSGQFSPDDIQIIKETGIEKIVSLRTKGELDWDERAAVESAGLEYLEFPFLTPDSLTDEIFEQVCVLFRDSDGRTLVHCGGADRVGAVWLVHRVLNDGLTIEQAVAEATQVGLKTEVYKEKAIEFIAKQQPVDERDLTESSPTPVANDRQDLQDDKQETTNETAPPLPARQQEKSVVPGINDSFLDPELSPEQYVERFEIESREIYGSRMHVLKACKVEAGMRIADIGAGTGIFTRLFANQVGNTGWVFAIDIAPRFLEHINQQSRQHRQPNVSAILCQEDSICLPPDSIDLAFICDTYHHFEYPQSTLASIYSALKPGGRMVVIDFIRIEGVSRPWVLGHVRAGEEVFTSEIEKAGFELQDKVQIPGFEENYFLIFSKKGEG